MDGPEVRVDGMNEILSDFEVIKLQLDNPVNTIISCYTLLERAVSILPQELNSKGRPLLKATIRNAAINNGIEKAKIEKEFKYILMMRGMVVHQNNYDPTVKDAKGYINSVQKILNYIHPKSEE
ncbi:hypothetical protein [Dysgonomonas sp. ZJ279]|uniref:hypothetical protein n=1 Tax=Dysgonomonas sp. ZJ279 TaxID=2709796 RepID=UPI0013EA41F0|nr:hypothetical protein [Dysgonomonas sp. ZJ279]